MENVVKKVSIRQILRLKLKENEKKFGLPKIKIGVYDQLIGKKSRKLFVGIP